MTHMEIYKLIYRVYKILAIELGNNEDSASRLANIVAVRLTGVLVNDKEYLKTWTDLDNEFRKEGYYD